MKSKLLFIVLFYSALSWGQASLPVSRTTWNTGEPTGWTDSGTGSYTSSFACSGNNGGRLDSTGDYYLVNFTGTPSTLTFATKATATPTGCSLLVEESIDGNFWTTVVNLTSLTTTCNTNGAYALNGASQYVRWSYTKSGSVNLTIDDVSITSGASLPIITLTPATLSGFTYVVGSGPSAQQNYSVSGTNLTANVVLTAPAGYSISTTSGSGYTNSISLPFGSGTLASTTIYVQLNSGLSVSTYTGNITAASTGAATKNVALTGSVTGSFQSDLVAVTGSEAATISSTINNNAPLTSTTGVQVWQFKVRDGGVSLNDSDNLPTILNAFTIAQSGGNAIGTWTDAINSIALFDGSTFIASGTVTASNITFSGLNISVADDTEKTLSIRLSLKCPLGADAFDNEDFGFSISNTNVTFSAAGSSKFAFPAISNPNNTNFIQVIATQLQFLNQPQTTGVNGLMSTAVTVIAKDACGNTDLTFSGVVSLTSSGTMTGSPILKVAVNGVATFPSITHTVVASGLTLNASATEITSATSATFDILNITTLKPGDIAIFAFNTNISGEDEISFVTFVDILPGTTIDITDNAYQKCGTPNGWGISEGWIRLVRTNATLLKGTIITVRVNTSGFPYIFSPDPTNWNCSKPQPTLQGTFNLNNNGEQIFFMSGGNVGGLNETTATTDAGTYSGYFLYGFNTKNNIWAPVCGNAAAGGSQNSDKPENFDCFLTWPTAQADLNKYSGSLSPATQRDWLARIGNPNNWTGYTDNTAYDAGPNFYGGSISIIAAGYSDGVWIGDKNANWYECSNWQSLRVPDETVNVIIGSNATQKSAIDYTAPFSDYYFDIAKCNDLTISNQSLDLLANSNNVLEVHGNLFINGTGILNMDDTNPGTADGKIDLYGNWTNTAGNSSFNEGNGTVNFAGINPQIISNVAPLGTESFYNVVLNNDFDTAVSNDIVAEGNLDINANKNVSIDSNGYIRVNKALNLNGNLTIENNGQLIQVDETDTNTGTYSGTSFQVKRTAMVKNLDFVYWCTPIDNFAINSLPTNYRFEWNPIYNNTNGTQGYWRTPSTTNMTRGRGYISRASNGSATSIPLNITFQGGKPHNGTFTTSIQRGSYFGDGITTGLDYDAEPSNPNNVLTTRWDDNWNLIGNPFPSAINAMTFLDANTNIEGFVNIWTHQTDPNSLGDPFYQNFGYNYTPNDYISHNGTGTVSGPGGFNGNIASGQGFFVIMSDGAASSSTVTFSNAMRSDVANQLNYNNNQFYRNSNLTVPSTDTNEKNRIWLDIVSANGSAYRTLIGYVSNATNEKDRLYDAITQYSNQLKIYSYLNTTDEQEFSIQGRSLPFDVNDTVKIGVSVPTNGIYSIAIAAVDGLFNNNQEIYIQDNLSNTVNNITNTPYTFSSDAGNFTDRFVLRYTDSTLSDDEFQAINSSVVVVGQNNQVLVKSFSETITSVEIYDVLGRLIATKEEKSSEIVINNLTINNQALIVKTKLENGQVIAKKIKL